MNGAGEGVSTFLCYVNYPTTHRIMISADSATTVNGRDQIDIFFTVDGKKIPFNDFEASGEGEIVKRTARMVREEVELVRCPVHEETASSITFVNAENGQYISYKVDGCCQKLVDRVESLLR
jgi:hypothetical protein